MRRRAPDRDEEREKERPEIMDCHDFDELSGEDRRERRLDLGLIVHRVAQSSSKSPREGKKQRSSNASEREVQREKSEFSLRHWMSATRRRGCCCCVFFPVCSSISSM